MADRGKTLIDRCAKREGSHAALARKLGFSPQALHRFKKGDSQMPTAVLAHLCTLDGISGDEARELLALLEIENPKHDEVRELLQRAFFLVWAIGVALIPQHLDAEAATSTLHSLYIGASRLLRRIGQIGQRPTDLTGLRAI